MESGAQSNARSTSRGRGHSNRSRGGKSRNRGLKSKKASTKPVVKAKSPDLQKALEAIRNDDDIAFRALIDTIGLVNLQTQPPSNQDAVCSIMKKNFF